ncbi:hypothetical protein DHBDCA_p2486 [Dehalobacter sp. DCA]|nr:hypothetical protein DHBDCA_p2486 [Dehalobacter sp. DCA]AFV06498.1 hypothetical protein DCF50_p2495 [Dehalobacter sp. CF]
MSALITELESAQTVGACQHTSVRVKIATNNLFTNPCSPFRSSQDSFALILII